MSGCQAGKYKAVRNKTQMQTIGQTETVQELIHKMNAQTLTVMGKKRERELRSSGENRKEAGESMLVGRWSLTGSRIQVAVFRVQVCRFRGHKGAKQH